MSLVIGITGYKRSGKGEIENHLARTYSFQSLAMATPLKNMLRSLGLTEEEIHGSLKEQPSPTLLGVTPRLAMQTLGTEWGRMMIHNDLWVEMWKTKAKAITAPVVASDVRFLNEEKAIRSLGGKVLRVVRPGFHGSNHPSETEMDDIDADYTITNNGTIYDLRKAVDRAFQILGLARR
jgi:hypothetical protein